MPGTIVLAWASASRHHLADPDRFLARFAAAIRPGGLLVVIELSGFPRFVPDYAPGGAVESRAHALLAADRATDMPTMGSDWGPRLTRADLVVELERKILVDLTPSTPGVGAHPAATLTRIRETVADRLDSTDRGSLDALLAGGTSDIRRRTDLRVSTERRLWIARRPAASTPQALPAAEVAEWRMSFTRVDGGYKSLCSDDACLEPSAHRQGWLTRKGQLPASGRAS